MMSQVVREESALFQIQPDWSEATEGNFWVTLKEPHHGSQQFSIDCQPNGSTKTSDDCIEISRRNHELTLRCSRNASTSGNGLANSLEFEDFRFVPAMRDLNMHTSCVVSIDISDKSFGVSGDLEGVVKIWEPVSGSVQHVLEHHGVYRTKFFPSGVVILSCGGDLRLRIWDAESGQLAAVLEGHQATVTDQAFLGRGRKIISCSKDGSALFWDVPTQSIISRLVKDRGLLNCIHVDSEVDENVLVIGGETGDALMLDLRTPEGDSLIIKKCADAAINAVSYLDENLVGFGMENGCLEIVDRRHFPGGPVRQFTDSASPILALKKHGPHRLLLTRQDGTVVSYPSPSLKGQRISLTGSKWDAVTDAAVEGESVTTVFASCRDHVIRKYRMTL